MPSSKKCVTLVFLSPNSAQLARPIKNVKHFFLNDPQRLNIFTVPGVIITAGRPRDSAGVTVEVFNPREYSGFPGCKYDHEGEEAIETGHKVICF